MSSASWTSSLTWLALTVDMISSSANRSYFQTICRSQEHPSPSLQEASHWWSRSYMFFFYHLAQTSGVGDSKVVILFLLDDTAVEKEILTCRWNPRHLHTSGVNSGTCFQRREALSVGPVWLKPSHVNLPSPTWKTIKAKFRPTVTDDHLSAWPRLATSCYTSDDEKLASTSRRQRSH